MHSARSTVKENEPSYVRALNGSAQEQMQNSFASAMEIQFKRIVIKD